MARLRDTPGIIRQIGFVTFLKRLWCQIGEDNVFTWGSALAYSWMFAIFPFLIFLLSLVPLIPEKLRQDAKPTVNQWIDTTIPSPQAAELIKEQAMPLLDKQSAGGFLSLGLLLTLWAASRGMAMTMTALDKAYDIEKPRPFWKQSLLAIAITLTVTIMIIVVMVLLPLGSAVLAWMANHGASWFPGLEISAWVIVLVNLTRYALALTLLFAVIALIYHLGPNLKQKFHPITPGAVFCVAVWLTLGLLFKVYLQKFGGAESYDKTYGAVAGLVILLLFFYIDSLVLLVGAEINSELDFAAAGIPSGDSPEQQAIAPIQNEENQALAAELQEKRTET